MAQEVRLNKLISRRGLASRRAAEALIAEGKVVVNGDVADHPGMMVDPDVDTILIDGEALPPAPKPIYFLLYKPKGTITSRDDPEGRKSVLSLLPSNAPRVEPVGRLDFDTEGALLLTNDGDLAHKLTHPSTQVPRRYRAKVYRQPTDRSMALIRQGKVYLDDGPTHPAKARVVEATDKGNTWVEITVTEGRNRLIRRMFAQLGHPVSKLRRESFATISIRGMERGDVRELTGDELLRLQDIAAGVAAMNSGRAKYKPGFARPKPKKKRHGQHRSKRTSRKS